MGIALGWMPLPEKIIPNWRFLAELGTLLLAIALGLVAVVRSAGKTSQSRAQLLGSLAALIPFGWLVAFIALVMWSFKSIHPD